jgi:hypothetical protein
MRQIAIEVLTMTVTFFDIKIAGGWKVIASITRSEIEGLPIISGKIDDISELKDYNLNHCDHCGISRLRNKVIVLDDVNGNRKIVGSSCIKDYIGIDLKSLLLSVDLQNYINALFAEYSFGSGENDDELPSGFVSNGISVDTLAYCVCAIVRNDKWGYTKREQDAYGDDYNSTSHKVTMLISAMRSPSNGSDSYIKSVCNDNATDMEVSKRFLDEAKATYTIEKLKSGTLNSFEQSFGIIVNSSEVPEKQMNLFIGMLGYKIAKGMHVKTEKKFRDSKKSEYMYTIGEKVKSAEVEIAMTRSCQSSFGCSLMVSGYFAGTDNAFVTFMNGDTSFLKNEDGSYKATVSIKFTVKNHQDKGYGKQTVLLRVKEAK